MALVRLRAALRGEGRSRSPSAEALARQAATPLKVAVSSQETASDKRAFVRFRDVQKSYDGETLVVKGLSLDVGRGEFLTLLGPSGSGKTTLLMMLAGFEMPTAGTINVAGRDLTFLPPHKREIGMVFQSYALFPHMSVAENVAFPLMARGRPKTEIAARVGKALARVKMEAFSARRPAQLSGGQQQRVALARALVYEPALVLMDEPLGALDKQLREHLQMEIRLLHEELGITVIYVTHDQDEALAMSDRIAVFNDGAIEQIGTAKAIYEAPETAFVSSFVGENNHLPGSLASRLADGRALVSASGADILATPVGDLAEGSPVLLSLRPERISVVSDRTPFDNALPATVTELIYLGDHLRMRCRVGEGACLTVKMANAADMGDRHVGDAVLLGWRAGDCRVLPVTNGGPK